MTHADGDLAAVIEEIDRLERGACRGCARRARAIDAIARVVAPPAALALLLGVGWVIVHLFVAIAIGASAPVWQGGS